MTIERLLSSSKSQKASSPGSCVVFGLLSQLREVCFNSEFIVRVHYKINS